MLRVLQPSVVPSVVRDWKMSRVWYRQDDTFLLPKACISIMFTRSELCHFHTCMLFVSRYKMLDVAFQSEVIVLSGWRMKLLLTDIINWQLCPVHQHTWILCRQTWLTCSASCFKTPSPSIRMQPNWPVLATIFRIPSTDWSLVNFFYINPLPHGDANRHTIFKRKK